MELECQVTFSSLPENGEPGAALVTKYSKPDQPDFWLGVTGDGSRTWELCSDGVCARSSLVAEENTNYCVHVSICDINPSNPTPFGEIWVGVRGEPMVLVAQASMPLPEDTSLPVSLGGHSSNPFFGMIDEVRLGCSTPCPNPVEPITWGTIKSVYR
jgi:hypothetical protein